MKIKLKDQKLLQQSDTKIPKIQGGRIFPSTEKNKQISMHVQNCCSTNVNDYIHFLKNASITADNINWVSKLRKKDDDWSERIKKMPHVPFTVASKRLEGQSQKHDVQDTNFRDVITHHEHLMRHRVGSTPHLSTINYETSLRGGFKSKNAQKYQQLEKGFRFYSRKQCKDEFPEFLHNIQEEIRLKKKMKQTGIPQKLTYSGFDGQQNFPAVNENLHHTRNINDQRHLHDSTGCVSQISWAMSLR